MTYEVWETCSGNLAGSYPSQAAALRVVREAARVHGRAYLDTFALVCEDQDENARTVASGAALADLADRAGPTELHPDRKAVR